MQILAVVTQSSYLQKCLYNHVGITCVEAYWRADTFWAKVRRRFCLEFPEVSSPLSQDMISLKLENYNLIIVNEMTMPEPVLAYIRKRNPSCRILYVLWNTLQYIGVPFGKKRNDLIAHLLQTQEQYNFRIVSFDEGDCNKYHLIHNQQFSYKIDGMAYDAEPKESIFFCGNDKGRADELARFSDFLNQKRISHTFWIVPNKKTRHEIWKDNEIVKIKPMPYESIIEEMQKYTVILEFAQKGQGGLTWNALAAVFYGKKLITNLKEIQHYDFYHKDNIFILGVNPLEGLTEWMAKPLHPIPEEIIRKYTFSGWLDSLLNKITLME